jgi:hypothetical protein
MYVVTGRDHDVRRNHRPPHSTWWDTVTAARWRSRPVPARRSRRGTHALKSLD